MPSAASISSDVSTALWTAQRPQSSAPQPDASPFAALLDAATAPPAPPPDAGTAAADNGPAPQSTAQSGSATPAYAGASSTTGSAGNTPGAGAPPNGTPAQSADAGASSPSGPAGNGMPGADAGAAPKGAAAQIAHAIGTLKGATSSRKLANSNPGKAAGNEAAKIVQPPPLASNGSAAAPTSNGNANSTNTSPAPAVNASAKPDSQANDSTDTASNAAVAAAFNAAVSADGVDSANSATPGASKTPGGKDDQSNQNNDAADPTSDSSSAKPAQLPSLDAAQPVAVAISGNATANAVPAVAKTASAVADVLKARAKATLAAAPAGQNTPTQASDTDPAASASTTDSGATDGSTSAASDTPTSDNSTPTTSPQQTPGQPGAATAALLTQIDFVSSGGAERLGVHAEATALNGAGVSATPAASANTTIAPNFGVFAANAMTTNGTAPTAAGSDTLVPVAGLAVAIAARAQGGSSQFDIRLDPPELGRIDVRLGVDGSGQVTTHVTVDRADTLQLLQSQQPQLQQALEQAGLKTADNGLQFTLRDQSFAGQNGGSGGQQQPAPPPQLVIPQPDVAPIDTAQIYARLRLGNGLDIRV